MEIIKTKWYLRVKYFPTITLSITWLFSCTETSTHIPIGFILKLRISVYDTYSLSKGTNVWAKDLHGEAETYLLFHTVEISGTEAFRGAYFGEGSGPIFLDKLTCSGQESMLLDCDTRTPHGVHSCEHSQDAGVKCIGTILFILYAKLFYEAKVFELQVHMFEVF